MAVAARIGRRAWLAAGLALMLALGACSHLPPPGRPDTPARTWEGQMSVKLEAHAGLAADGTTFSFVLALSDADTGQLALMTPMGTQVAQVDWSAQGAQLHDGQGRRDYADLDSLSLALMGEVLPLRALPHWLDGQPDPTLPATPLETGFDQAGWRVDLSQFDQARLRATRAATDVQRGIQIRARLTR